MDAIKVIESIRPHYIEKIKYRNSRSTIDIIKKRLENSVYLAVADCSCRICDRKPDAYLILDEGLIKSATKDKIRKISFEEAIMIATLAKDAGLEFMEYTPVSHGSPSQVSFICIGCSCCHLA